MALHQPEDVETRLIKMDFNDLLSFVQNVPMSAAQNAKAGLAGQQIGVQNTALSNANDQFNKDLALRSAQQLWEQQMGGKQFDLQAAQQAWQQNHAGQEFDLEKAQQEWQQNQGAQDFALKQKLALGGNDRANNAQASDLLTQNMDRSLSAIKASQMLQDYFAKMNPTVGANRLPMSPNTPYTIRPDGTAIAGAGAAWN